MKRTFIYHEKDDTEPAELLHKFIKPLEDNGLMEITLSSKASLGVNEADWIRQQILCADLVLLIVTVNLCGAKNFDDLIKLIFEQRQAGKCVVVPVIYRSCMWQETLFVELEVLPEKGAPVKSPVSFPSEDDGFTAVGYGVKKLLDDFEQKRIQPKNEVENLKSALLKFNFHEQLTQKFDDSQTKYFSLIILKGEEKGGHHLLAWRWRTEIACAPASIRPFTIRLTETKDSSDEISREIHRCLAGPAHDDNLSYSPVKVASKLFERLQNECLVIRLDDFNHSFQQQAIEDFFNQLHTELENLSKENGAPPHRLWFFLFHRVWSLENDFYLQAPSKIELPPIKVVDEEVFNAWKEDADKQGHFSALIRTRLTQKTKTVLSNQPDQNQPLDVLERLCNTVFAKTQLYDEFILTFE